MTYIVSAWGVVLAMCAWAIYLYFAWAGMENLPMQWGLTGHPTWYASRGVAVAFIPAMAILVVGLMTIGGKGPHIGAGVLLTSMLLLAVQGLWAFLAARYV